MFKSKLLLTCLILAFSFELSAQKFPDSFVGTWKGPLTIYNGATPRQTVTAMLEVYPADSGRYDWIITYGDSGEDRRPYSLIPIDTAKGHWAIDEHNGIVIDMYATGNKFTSLFSVEGSAIQISYWIENDVMMMELFVYPEGKFSQTGLGTEESPTVHVWKFSGYQLAKMKHMRGVK